MDNGKTLTELLAGKKIVDYHVIRMLSIFSTATGYDIHVYRRSQEFGWTKRRVFKNVSAASMRRFYRASHQDMDFQGPTLGLGWQQHSRMFSKFSSSL